MFIIRDGNKSERSHREVFDDSVSAVLSVISASQQDDERLLTTVVGTYLALMADNPAHLEQGIAKLSQMIAAAARRCFVEQRNPLDRRV